MFMVTVGYFCVLIYELLSDSRYYASTKYVGIIGILYVIGQARKISNEVNEMTEERMKKYRYEVRYVTGAWNKIKYQFMGNGPTLDHLIVLSFYCIIISMAIIIVTTPLYFIDASLYKYVDYTYEAIAVLGVQIFIMEIVLLVSYIWYWKIYKARD